jgi:hypothetical protein
MAMALAVRLAGTGCPGLLEFKMDFWAAGMTVKTADFPVIAPEHFIEIL